MVDYLEESLERAEALLEEVRRLEGGLSALKAERKGEATPSGAEEEGGQAEAGREGGAGTEQAGAGSLLEGVSDPLPGRSGAVGELKLPGRILTPPEERESQAGGLERPGTPALLRQMKQLERAAAVSAGDMSPNRRAGTESPGSYPVSLPGPRAAALPGVTAGAGLGQSAALSGALSADEARWAERADRVFRRDSRRYDGGFYLY